MSTERPRYTITVTDEMLKAIDDFRFENRYPTRTEATNELIRLGLEAIEAMEAQGRRFSRKSDKSLEEKEESAMPYAARKGDADSVAQAQALFDEALAKLKREKKEKS